MQIVLVHSHLGPQLRDLMRHGVYTNGEMFVGYVPESSLQRFREAFPEYWEELVNTGTAPVPDTFYDELQNVVDDHYKTSR